MSPQIAPHSVVEEREIDEDLESLKRVMMRQKVHYRHSGLPRTQAQIDAVLLRPIFISVGADGSIDGHVD